MNSTATQSKSAFLSYRIKTIINSFRFLYNLSPEKVDSFVRSFEVYDQEWEQPKDMEAAIGPHYEDVLHSKIVDCYSVLTHLCAIGQVEKMYIPPALDLSKSIIQNQLLFEKKMARDLGLKPGQSALEMGCGRGRISNHVASQSGAHITGINIDPDQIASATEFAQRTGRANQCTFKKWSFNSFPFPFEDNSFDAVYEVQACSYSKNLDRLFQEVYRVLKPGGKMALLEWGTYDAYDSSNSHHAYLMRQTKQVIEAVWSPHVRQYVDAMKKAGFEILVDENLSIDGKQAPLIENAHRFYTKLAKVIRFLVFCRILPEHFVTLFTRLSKGGDQFIEADRLGLVTTSHYVVAKKNG